MISVTSGLPFVKVPVLSKTIVFILQAISNGSPPFDKIAFGSLTRAYHQGSWCC